MADLIPDEALEAAAAAVMDVRDASPRLPNDANSYDVAAAALSATAPLIVAAELDRLADEIEARDEGDDTSHLRDRAAALRSEGDTHG